MLASSSNGSDVGGKWTWEDNDTVAAKTTYVIGISISHDDDVSIVRSKFNDNANLTAGADAVSVSMQSWEVDPEESIVQAS